MLVKVQDKTSRQAMHKPTVLENRGVYSVILRINQSSRGESGKCSSAVCLSVWLVGACYSLSVRGLQFVMSFQGENHPDPKSSQDLDLDKPGM